jgi:hypothetical protein
MWARFTVLNQTPIASAIAGCVIPLSPQQHHLNALTLRRRDFPVQRCFQFPDLLSSALDHPSPESDSQSGSYCDRAPQKNTEKSNESCDSKRFK